ncbi:MAG: ABC transporter permease subunit [Lentisphaeria bacterium]|nr:ABC transporter permease subunit [Candidatus Neomarinimicrobiota bacterium]MCF7841440.1 ABC transporter permease subunit [Lentisphaeria bacterium]
MATYFLRRLLLLIPTFFGATILVFIILQLAPGGPLEQTIRQIQMGGMTQGEGGSAGAGDMTSGGGAGLPAEAMEELKRFYGFDKPIIQRYLIWLGVWPREHDSRNLEFGPGENEVEKNMGRGQWVTVKKTADGYVMYNDDGSINSDWLIRPLDPAEDGAARALVYKTKLSGILTGDLGTSYTYMQPVLDVMKPRFKISIFFGISGFLISYIVCIPLGIAKALRHGSPFDLFSSVIVFIAYSIPGWALGAVLLLLLGGGSFWDVFPLGGFRSENWEYLSLWGKVMDQLYHAVLPMIAWTIGSFATLTVLMKNSIIENMSQDYIRTAFSKGLTEKRVIWIHALRNSVIPIASYIGNVIGVLLAGSYLIELVFNIDGFGKLGYQAVLDRDYPIVMGFLVIAVLLRLIGNILSDIALATVDPRIRFK